MQITHGVSTNEKWENIEFFMWKEWEFSGMPTEDDRNTAEISKLERMY